MSATRGQTTTNLYLLEELEHETGTRELADSDLRALRAVADWITTFVAKPHADLGRDGSVCPFVPGALERHTLWLAPEQTAGRSVADVAGVITGYQSLFKDGEPRDGEDVVFKSFVVVFTDLADRAGEFFDGVLERIAATSYVEQAFVMGGFYEDNQGAAIYNASFRPFTSPVPFLLMRQAVVSDWKFFLDDERWLDRWAHRYGEEGARALAAELRRLPWRTTRP